MRYVLTHSKARCTKTSESMTICEHFLNQIQKKSSDLRNASSNLLLRQVYKQIDDFSFVFMQSKDNAMKMSEMESSTNMSSNAVKIVEQKYAKEHKMVIRQFLITLQLKFLKDENKKLNEVISKMKHPKGQCQFEYMLQSLRMILRQSKKTQG